MKKTLTLFLAILMLFALPACSSGGKVGQEETGGSSVQEDPKVETNLQAAKPIPEDTLLQTGIVVISGMEHPDMGDSISPLLLPLEKKISHFTHEAEGLGASHRALLISANDDTRIRLYPVLGWNEETNGLDTGDPIFDGDFQRGEAFIVDYYETETLPSLLAIITAEDGHTQTSFDFSYDGKGDSTENGITRRVIQYGLPDEDAEWSDREIVDHLYALALRQ